MNHCKLCELTPPRLDKSYNYVCFTCNYHTQVRTDMARHVRRHTGDKPYKCAFCSYSSKTNKNLVHHIKTHTGEKPFQCSHCTYVCARKSHLKLHLRRKHFKWYIDVGFKEVKIQQILDPYTVKFRTSSLGPVCALQFRYLIDWHKPRIHASSI